MALRVTFISKNLRSSPRVFDTDDPGEAVTQFVANWRDKPDGPWAFCLVVEEVEGESMSRNDFSTWLRRLLNIETVRHNS